MSKEKVDWTFRVPGLLVLLAAKRTDKNDNKKNKRQQTKKQVLLTWLVKCELISKFEFIAYAFSAVPFPKGDETACCRAGDDYHFAFSDGLPLYTAERLAALRWPVSSSLFNLFLRLPLQTEHQ